MSDQPLPLKTADRVTFSRDCPATQIPSGTQITIPHESEAFVGQTLGGNVTLQVPSLGMLVQISSRNLDALLKDGHPVAAPIDAQPETADEVTGPANDKDIWKVLKTCYDPEIPVNIVDLGLVYDVKLTDTPSGGSRVDVKMTLTAMGCGMGPAIAAQAKDKILQVHGVKDANVDIVWDPPWNQSMITDDGKKRLGLW